MTARTVPFFALIVLACGGAERAEPAAPEATSDAPSTAEVTEAPAEATRRETLVEAGEEAPAFAAPDQTGTERTLAAERGRAVVLYFYPRDATPGCTREACAFRDVWTRYEEAGIRVFGVSTDTVESHAAFAEEHELPFPLLADPEARIADAYGVPHPGGFMYRVTFLIDGGGRVARVFPRVDPGVHAEEVLAAAADLGED